MKAAHRSLSVLLLALLLVLVAGPVAAARCRMSGYCPMMAKASGPAACHGSAGTLSAPMDCCRPTAVPAPASVLAGLEPLPVAVVATLPVAARVADRAVAASFSRAGKLHPLGLFTLHSIWRI